MYWLSLTLPVSGVGWDWENSFRKKEGLLGTEWWKHQGKRRGLLSCHARWHQAQRKSLWVGKGEPSIPRGSINKRKTSFRGEEGIICEIRAGREMFSTPRMPKTSQRIRDHVTEGMLIYLDQEIYKNPPEAGQHWTASLLVWELEMCPRVSQKWVRKKLIRKTKLTFHYRPGNKTQTS